MVSLDLATLDAIIRLLEIGAGAVSVGVFLRMTIFKGKD